MFDFGSVPCFNRLSLTSISRVDIATRSSAILVEIEIELRVFSLCRRFKLFAISRANLLLPLLDLNLLSTPRVLSVFIFLLLFSGRFEYRNGTAFVTGPAM